MRNLCCVLLIICTNCLPSQVFGQTERPANEEQQIRSLLCQKWRLIVMDSDGRIINIPAGEASYLNFKNDGTYTDSTARFKVSNGLWTFNQSDKVLETIDKGGKSKIKIVTINSNELKTEIKYTNAIMFLTYKKDE